MIYKTEEIPCSVNLVGLQEGGAEAMLKTTEKGVTQMEYISGVRQLLFFDEEYYQIDIQLEDLDKFEKWCNQDSSILVYGSKGELLRSLKIGKCDICLEGTFEKPFLEITFE